MSKRILYITSKIWDWYESQNCEEHFAHAPYSIDAIGYNLKNRWPDIAWACLRGTLTGRLQFYRERERIHENDKEPTC